MEFCYNDEWGTVCDDFWDSLDAIVVCRELGFSSGARSFGQARFGEGTGPILLDHVNCTGTESRLANCPANAIGVHNCIHGEDAGVRCTSGTCGFFWGCFKIRVCMYMHEYFWLVLCWEVCPLSECAIRSFSVKLTELIPW